MGCRNRRWIEGAGRSRNGLEARGAVFFGYNGREVVALSPDAGLIDRLHGGRSVVRPGVSLDRDQWRLHLEPSLNRRWQRVHPPLRLHANTVRGSRACARSRLFEQQHLRDARTRADRTGEADAFAFGTARSTTNARLVAAAAGPDDSHRSTVMQAMMPSVFTAAVYSRLAPAPDCIAPSLHRATSP